MAPVKGASKGGFAQWYERIVNFNVEDLFSRKREPGPPRTIYVNTPPPPDHYGRNGKVKKENIFTSNQVISSKYTLITFLPRNLLEQFRRIANLFFLFIAILQFFPMFSTVSRAVVILPLIVVLAITALKDGYEDFKRHQSDRSVNYSRVDTLSGPGWTNANRTQAKSKTFIRAVASTAKKRKTTGTQQGSGNVYWDRVKWEDVRVGDFVKIKNNEAIPADILICSVSGEDNIAFVETMNLDGETNLKSRHGVTALEHLRTPEACAAASFQINADRPDNDMYRLNGYVTVNGEKHSTDLSMTLLRGTTLRNTDWVIGVVMFTGLDSKIVMNSGGTPSKRSKVERQMNPQVFINLILLAAMATVCGIADSLLEQHYFPLGAPWLFGADDSDDNPKINGLITFVFALLTFQTVVPISLYISIEVVKTLQAAFIYLDGDIFYEKTGRATMARSWNLSDDLGQIEYIFSDKTGTLTQNLMVFRQCSISGKSYKGDDPVSEKPEGKGDVDVSMYEASGSSTRTSRTSDGDFFYDTELLADVHNAALSPSSDSAVYPFFKVLGLCHTVLAATDEDRKIEYRAQSPDEAALVRAAADVGFVFLGKDREVLTIQLPYVNGVERYQLLDILEFTSARKRMSVVVREIGKPNAPPLLLTKGADNVIFERLGPGQDERKAQTEVHLSEFANDGLRTLTLAYREIPEDVYADWSQRYHDATVALENREALVESVSSELEQNLVLLGATAIEDRLQDGVPETIRDLKKAGIKIWVATGDKMETAIAIGRSTNLIQATSNIIIVRGGTGRPVHTQMSNVLEEFFDDALEVDVQPPMRERPGSPTPAHTPIPLRRVNTGLTDIVGAGNGQRPGGFILVVDGAALLEAFADEENKATLLRLATLCEAVICCRVSPLQKALIVRLVKDGLGAMTLAVGDGANDVSMIQAADVGVGIAGEEGLQAVNSSDYSIGQFRFLKKLLLVHGHWDYARNGLMIINFFYKNIIGVGVLWWFQIYCGWSATYVFDYVYILFWNSLFTVAAVVGIGLFDRFLDAHVLMQVPELYRYGREGTWFGTKLFFVYVFDGVVQSAIIFFIILYTYLTTSTREDGYGVVIYEFSTTMALIAVLVANIFTGATATAWTWWLVFAVFFGTVVQWVFTVIYSLISPGYAVTNLFGNDYFVFHSAYFWLCLFLTFILSLAPRYFWKTYKFAFAPGDLETFQYLQKIYPGQDLSRFAKDDEEDVPFDHERFRAYPRRDSVAPSRNSSLESLDRVRPSMDKARVSMDNNRRSRPPIDRVRLSLDSRPPPASRPSMDSRPAPVSRPSMDVRDMSSGMRSMDRGFDFAMEEHGVALRRVQTDLSEARASNVNLSSGDKGKETPSRLKLSLSRTLLKKK